MRPRSSASLTPAVAEVVRQQAEVGIDVPSDGESASAGWTPYVADAWVGWRGVRAPTAHLIKRDGRHAATSEFRGFLPGLRPHRADHLALPVPRGGGRPRGMPAPSWPVHRACDLHRPATPIQRDIANFKAALQRRAGRRRLHARRRAGSVEPSAPNEYYPTTRRTSSRSPTRCKDEYHAIVDAGFVLQIDDACMPARYDRMLPHGARWRSTASCASCASRR